MSHLSPAARAPGLFSHPQAAAGEPPRRKAAARGAAAPTTGEPVSIGGDLVGPLHACAFFRDPDEEYRTLLPFAAHCAHRGERCVHYIDPLREQAQAERLARAGIVVAKGGGPGQLELRNWDDVYLRGGRFDQDAMLELIEAEMRGGRSFGRTRVWANMEWALQGLPGCEDLVEYESRLNPVVEKHSDIVICAYEHGRYSASVVMDILRTHPMVVVDEELRQNPLYVPTELFLLDLRQRRGPRPGLRSDQSRLDTQ
jgi:hypothetical protein